MAQVQVRGRSRTITFVYMHTGARHMLALAEQSLDGQLYTTISSLVFSAFTLEAYLNHLGALRYEDWAATERRRSKRRKFEMLAGNAGLAVDFGARPCRTLLELFNFRDRMAHGRTTSSNVTTTIDLNLPRLPQITGRSEWQAYATVENARQAIADVEALIRGLHRGSGYAGNPFASSGGGVYGLTRT